MTEDFLVELFTEELPPKVLPRLADAFMLSIKTQLEKAGLAFNSAQAFATPRRLAVLVKQLIAEQAPQTIERKGPALTAAYDHQGQPTPACIGFASSCGIAPEALQTLKTKQGEFVGYQQTIPGKPVVSLLPEIVQEALAQLPIPKRMHWGSKPIAFIRPVHSVVMLYGQEVIKTTILGLATGRVTYGHRFLTNAQPISIPEPSQYEDLLAKNYVLADFQKRRTAIRTQAMQIMPAAHTLIADDLLDEVTGIVEWPVAFCGKFSADFLQVPREVLISAMQDHQRYFPVEDEQQNLLPAFVAIANVENSDMSQIISGNERVLRARLADGKFFYEQDQVEPFKARVERLKGIVYHAKLGTLYDKAQRLAKLAHWICSQIGAEYDLGERAGLLAKADLTTNMVGEFPELQGVMGYYYALNAKEDMKVATAIREHYLPRFAGDALPKSKLGAALALADRIDTLTGIFGINQAPTGEKDPFGLRRAALGVIRILIEQQINLDLSLLLKFAQAQYSTSLENADTAGQILQFMQDRLKFWYQEQGIAADIFAAVAALNITRPYDLHQRIQAVQAFKKLTAAKALSVANKRVSNILAKANENMAENKIDISLFEHASEKNLFDQLEKYQHKPAANDYIATLTELAHLRQPVDEFFDHVMVMTEDLPRRKNRLILLSKLRALFLHVADIALLQ